ncbi:MAG: ATPase [Candidatus Diapherotrites archaeon]|uniref:ATPase n=1 Tax=Candidatus Iainarchaeum sp. TaxID=3101447 RepID=A0A8T4L864_9ARCH|nr:ATPase [Candidatus Diapherotrites archaeon]
MPLFETTAGIAMAAGLSIIGGALGTAWVQSAIGSSAMGVIAEKPEEASKLLIWLVIPETIVIFGFVIAIMLTLKIAG